MSFSGANQLQESFEKLNFDSGSVSTEQSAQTVNTEPEEQSESTQISDASASLYVGELNQSINEATLYEIFSPIGQIALIRVCRDAVTKKSLGYAYVNYHKHEDGEKAFEKLNYTLIEGRPCRIMWSQRDPTLRKNGNGNIFIKNLHPAIDNKALNDTFSAFGKILSCKVAIDDLGISKCFGFVHYETDDAAQAAIDNVNGMLLNDREVYVAKHISKKDRQSKFDEMNYNFTNVYVKNLDLKTTEDDLKKLFEPFGEVTSIFLKRDADDNSLGFGFINYVDHSSAVKAIEELNDKEINGLKIYVGRAQKKRERMDELKKLYETSRLEKLSKYQGVNLFVKYLDDSVDSEKLESEFKKFGEITSAKIMVDESGRSKGFGFVCFATPEEATKAIAEMNQSLVFGKPLYVALAQTKDVRHSQLEQQIQARNQMRMQSVAANGAIPGQFIAPMFYGHQNFFPSNSRGNIPFPALNSQMVMRRGQPFVGPEQWSRSGSNNHPVHIYNLSPAFCDFNSQNMRQQRGHYQNKNQNMKTSYQKDLGPAIANLPADQQKRILGEELYPKIVATGKAQHPEAAGKITGMILDLDNQEILSLLDDEDLFNSHFEDALVAFEEYKRSSEIPSAEV